MNEPPALMPSPRTPRRAGRVVRVLEICNKKGLHARASAKFVQTVEQFDADVRVTRGAERVGGTSIMGLMMLAAGPGTSITVEASGPQAAEVVEALAKLVAEPLHRRGMSSPSDIKKSLYLYCAASAASCYSARPTARQASRRRLVLRSHHGNRHDRFAQSRHQPITSSRTSALPNGAARKSPSPRPRCPA